MTTHPSRGTLMLSNPFPLSLTGVRQLFFYLLLSALSGCAGWGTDDPLNISVVGVEPLPAEGLELRFALTLRVQNPNEQAIDYDGIALEMQINDQPLASGVSDQKGQVPRFGESLIKVPLSISAYSMLRQAMGASSLKPGQQVRYELNGKLGGHLLGERFSTSGTLNWPSPASP